MHLLLMIKKSLETIRTPGVTRRFRPHSKTSKIGLCLGNSPIESFTLNVLHRVSHVYILFNEPILELDALKDLGIHIASDLKPEFHIGEAVSRAGRLANFIVRALYC